MSSEDAAKFLKEFHSRTTELLVQLQKAAGVGEGPTRKSPRKPAGES